MYLKSPRRRCEKRRTRTCFAIIVVYLESRPRRCEKENDKKLLWKAAWKGKSILNLLIKRFKLRSAKPFVLPLQMLFPDRGRRPRRVLIVIQRGGHAEAHRKRDCTVGLRPRRRKHSSENSSRILTKSQIQAYILLLPKIFHDYCRVKSLALYIQVFLLLRCIISCPYTIPCAFCLFCIFFQPRTRF